MEITPMGQNTDVEIRIAQFDLRCLVIQADQHGYSLFVEVVRVVRA
jgi:hypothetical protein